jgi:hypothetical protein
LFFKFRGDLYCHRRYFWLCIALARELAVWKLHVFYRNERRYIFANLCLEFFSADGTKFCLLSLKNVLQWN